VMTSTGSARAVIGLGPYRGGGAHRQPRRHFAVCDMHR
jgi:hypothetical protein